VKKDSIKIKTKDLFYDIAVGFLMFTAALMLGYLLKIFLY